MAHLGPEIVRQKFKGMVKRCADCGFDLAGGKVEVVPTAHYFMGGVVVDPDTRTELRRPLRRRRGCRRRAWLEPARRQRRRQLHRLRRRRRRRHGRATSTRMKALARPRRGRARSRGRARRAPASARRPATSRTCARRCRTRCGTMSASCARGAASPAASAGSPEIDGGADGDGRRRATNSPSI